MCNTIQCPPSLFPSFSSGFQPTRHLVDVIFFLLLLLRLVQCTTCTREDDVIAIQCTSKAYKKKRERDPERGEEEIENPRGKQEPNQPKKKKKIRVSSPRKVSLLYSCRSSASWRWSTSHAVGIIHHSRPNPSLSNQHIERSSSILLYSAPDGA